MTLDDQAKLKEARPERTEALPNGTELLGDQFTIIRRISNGGFGITYLAKDNYLDREVVIKECFPEVFCHREGASVLVRSQSNYGKYRSLVDMFMREARSIAKLRHPNIVGVHRVFEDNDTAYMALDLIEGQDISHILKEGKNVLSPSQVQNILVKLLDAIEMVHQRDLLHRDISPDNILLDKWGNPVLIDFGAAREQASRETRALSALLVVKDGYSPQEFYFAGGKQTECSDLYALASTFYHIITGDSPPNSQTRMAEAAAGGIDPCDPLVGRFDDYPETFLAAIDQAMSVLPRDRIQSARIWSKMISPKKREQVALVLPKQNKAAQLALSKLVLHTNERIQDKISDNIKDTQKLDVPVRHNVQEQAEAVEAAPVAAEASQTAIRNWVLEFNQETAVASQQRPKERPVRVPSRGNPTRILRPPQAAPPIERDTLRRYIDMSEKEAKSKPKVKPKRIRRFAGRVKHDYSDPPNDNIDALKPKRPSRHRFFGLGSFFSSPLKMRMTWLVVVFSVSYFQTDNFLRLTESLFN